MKSRTKPNLGWEKLNTESSGKLGETTAYISASQPGITVQQARMSALRKHGYTNGQIAEFFCITVHAVDNHFWRMGLNAEKYVLSRNQAKPDGGNN